MPSPAGHALAGLAAGWLVRGAPASGLRPSRRLLREALLLGGLGVLPDVDLLAGAHSGPTHSIGAALAVGFAAWALTAATGVSKPAVQWGAACMLAYASHILLDWLGSDTSPPIGIMALWPFSREYYASTLHVFGAVSRRYWQGGTFWMQNLWTLLRELVILVPPLAAIAMLRRNAER